MLGIPAFSHTQSPPQGLKSSPPNVESHASFFLLCISLKEKGSFQENHVHVHLYINISSSSTQAIELAEVVSTFLALERLRKTTPFGHFSLWKRLKAFNMACKNCKFNTNTKPSMSFSISFEENGQSLHLVFLFFFGFKLITSRCRGSFSNRKHGHGSPEFFCVLTSN